jgi:hypothetical protein
LNDDNDALWFDENDLDKMKLSDNDFQNENDGTTMPVTNDIKE